jgi:hypothetical protein
MNYGEYMRRKEASRSKIIGFQNGQDASLVTYKAQARVSTVPNVVPVKTSFSKIGGTVADIMDVTPKDGNSPTNATCVTGYSGVSGNSQSHGFLVSDRTLNVLLAAQGCAVCSDAPSSAPYNVVVPCEQQLSTIKNAPGVMKCCGKDGSQLYRNNDEIIEDQGRQAAFRTAYNLPNKLHGLRGPVINNR